MCSFACFLLKILLNSFLTSLVSMLLKTRCYVPRAISPAASHQLRRVYLSVIKVYKVSGSILGISFLCTRTKLVSIKSPLERSSHS